MTIRTGTTTQKWATFTYIGTQTTYISKLFKNTSVKIAFRTQNTIGQILQHNNNPNQNAHFKKSGIYQLTCPDCKKKYIRQTGHHFKKDIRNIYMTLNITMEIPNLPSILQTINTLLAP